jgi:hypothetical protein
LSALVAAAVLFAGRYPVLLLLVGGAVGLTCMYFFVVRPIKGK